MILDRASKRRLPGYMQDERSSAARTGEGQQGQCQCMCCMRRPRNSLDGGVEGPENLAVRIRGSNSLGLGRSFSRYEPHQPGEKGPTRTGTRGEARKNKGGPSQREKP